MKGAAKLVLLIVAILAVEASVLGAAAAGLLMHAACSSVDVRDHHFRRFSIHPLMCGSHIRIGRIHHVSVNVRQLDAALQDLADAPDSTIVETRKAMEHVVIRKVGSEIKIDVTRPDQEIHVSLPVSVIRIFSAVS